MIPPRVLVTGANGLVGQAMVRAVSRWPGADLLATGRGAHASNADLAGGYAQLDIRDGEAVERAFQDFAPRVVINQAAMSRAEDCEADKQACWAVNVDAVASLAAACYRHGAKLLQLSTDFVFDGLAGPYSESARPNPVGAYGRSKLASENAIHTSRLTDWAIVRTALVYGVPVGDTVRSDFMRWLVRELQADRPVRIASDQLRSPTYDDDLAAGIVALLRFRKSGVFHLAGQDVLSPLEFALRAAQHLSLDETLISGASTEALHPGVPRPLRNGLLILRAQTEIGFQPRPLEKALDHFAKRLSLATAPADSA